MECIQRELSFEWLHLLLLFSGGIWTVLLLVKFTFGSERINNYRSSFLACNAECACINLKLVKLPNYEYSIALPSHGRMASILDLIFAWQSDCCKIFQMKFISLRMISLVLFGFDFYIQLPPHDLCNLPCCKCEGTKLPNYICNYCSLRYKQHSLPM